jgi:hypothetical protein
MTLGSTVDGPVVEHGEMAVGRRMHVELDNVSARGERRPHRWQRILKERMLRGMDVGGCAGIALKPRDIVGLRESAMGEQHRSIRPLGYEPYGVVEKNEGREQADARGRVT